MSIQTVEEAAQKLSESYPIERAYDIVEGFQAGAAWQKELGIEWISVFDFYPLPKKGNHFINVLVCNEREWGLRTYDAEAKIWWSGFSVTHWAYINLPKTDK